VRYSQAHEKLEQGYIDSALQSAEEELRHNHSPLWVWRFRLIRAEALVRLGKAGDAIDLLGPEPPSLPVDVPARRKILQGQSLCQLKDFSGAADRLNEATRIANTDRPLLAEIFLVRGKCEGSQNHLDLAQQDYLRAQELAENTNTFIQASAMGNLAVLLMQGDHYDEAIDDFERLLPLTRQMQSPLLEQITLGNLGFCYAQLGDWKRAISFSEQAEKIAKQTQNKAAQERWLIDLGKAHFALWESSGEQAKTNYLEALSIAQELRDRDNTALCFHNLALIALRTHDPDNAETYLKEGEAQNSDRERLHFSLDAAKIAAARKQFAQAERHFRDLLPNTGRDAVLHSIVEQDLGRVYWEEKKMAQADQVFRDGIATAEKALAELKRPEYRMSFMDQIPFYDSYIQFLAAQRKPAEALKIAERSRAHVLAAALENVKARDPSLSIRALQALSKRRKQIILAYSMTDEKTFLWVISPKLFKFFELAGHRDLFPQIDAFNREIQDHRSIEDSPGGAKLYQALIQPAEGLAPKGSSVIIIPSKLLSLVNFEALIVPGPQPHYWIDDVDVQVTGSLGLLASEKSATGKSPPGVKELLSMGAPVEVTKDFPTLKHAPEEMQRVQGHFPADQVTLISGKDATPRAYRDSAPGRYRFLHLDTHGVASDLSPLDSAIILSPGADKSYKLYAREIKDIPLHADLVTISACYGSGTRWYQGEGLVGLTWAFLRAGAHQVVGALWEVDEASSPQLMDDFYGELTQSKSAAEALRDAKLKMLHSNSFYRHPYYWASLQLYTGS
jgi:CHAT domain-containing protein/Flp pilus assembly protein TadD